jgi:hypothetical protein
MVRAGFGSGRKGGCRSVGSRKLDIAAAAGDGPALLQELGGTLDDRIVSGTPTDAGALPALRVELTRPAAAPLGLAAGEDLSASPQAPADDDGRNSAAASARHLPGHARRAVEHVERNYLSNGDDLDLTRETMPLDDGGDVADGFDPEVIRK